MKLAEALQERADLVKNIRQLENRLIENAMVQEGEKPAEDPQQLLQKLEDCVERLNELVARINLTNCMTRKYGQSITELIAKRDCLDIKIRTYRSVAEAASRVCYRARGSEIKILSTLNVSDMQNRIDEMCKERRETENIIQEINWTTDLL